MHIESPALVSRSFRSLDSVLKELSDLAKRTPMGPDPAHLDRSLKDAASIWPQFSAQWQNDPLWQTNMMSRAYLSSDGSLGLNVNCQRYLDTDPRSLSQAHRSVVLMLAAYSLYRDIQKGSLAACQERGRDLDMRAFDRIFGWERRPGARVDIQVKEPACEHFCVVLWQGQMFKLDLSQHPNAMLKAIIQIQKAPVNGPPIGLGTLLPRRQWANVRQGLESAHPINQENFKTLSEALFVLCLDMESPADPQALIQATRDRNFENRYFDKGLQLFCFANAQAGFIYEHSLADGHPIGRIARELYQRSLEQAVPQLDDKEPAVAALEWRCVSDDLVNRLKLWATQSQEAMGASFFLSFPLGKLDCEKRQLSADAIMQAALLRAAYCLEQRPLAASEAIHMRHFVAGRYETIMTLSSFMADALGDWPRALSPALLSQVSKDHKALVASCKRGESGFLVLSALLAELNVQGADAASRTLGQLLDPPVSTSNPGLGGGLALASFTDIGDKIGVLYAISDHQSLFACRLQGAWRSEQNEMKAALSSALGELTETIKGM